MGSRNGGSEMRQTIADLSGVKLERVAITGMQATFSVVVDGNEIGKLSFGKYYEPALAVIDSYVALWAGPTLCVIDRHHSTMQCIDRDDETHCVHAFESAWIV